MHWLQAMGLSLFQQAELIVGGRMLMTAGKTQAHLAQANVGAQHRRSEGLDLQRTGQAGGLPPLLHLGDKPRRTAGQYAALI